jgi:hypothetical protein
VETPGGWSNGNVRLATRSHGCSSSGRASASASVTIAGSAKFRTGAMWAQQKQSSSSVHPKGSSPVVLAEIPEVGAEVGPRSSTHESGAAIVMTATRTAITAMHL